MTTRWMLFDQQRCFGCNACVVACQQEYDLPAQVRFNRVELTMTGTRAAGNMDIAFRPLVCNQCDNAPCERVCPVGAIRKDPTSGVVLTDRAKCVACRICTTPEGCPYRMRSVDRNGLAWKCDFCLESMRAGETDPYCVKTCPSGARRMTTTQPVGTTLPSQRGAIPRGVVYGNIPVA